MLKNARDKHKCCWVGNRNPVCCAQSTQILKRVDLGGRDRQTHPFPVHLHPCINTFFLVQGFLLFSQAEPFAGGLFSGVQGVEVQRETEPPPGSAGCGDIPVSPQPAVMQLGLWGGHEFGKHSPFGCCFPRQDPESFPSKGVHALPTRPALSPTERDPESSSVCLEVSPKPQTQPPCPLCWKLRFYSV